MRSKGVGDSRLDPLDDVRRHLDLPVGREVGVDERRQLAGHVGVAGQGRGDVARADGPLSVSVVMSASTMSRPSVSTTYSCHMSKRASNPSTCANLVFTDEDGQPLQRQTFSAKVWRLAVAKAGAPADTRFHDLRHYYASLLIQHGESVKTVQVRLGHATAAETLDTYSHLWPDSEDRTREAVDLVMGRSRLGVANG